MALKTCEEQNFKVVIRLRPPSDRELHSEFFFENTSITRDQKTIQIRDYFDYIPGSFAHPSPTFKMGTKGSVAIQKSK